MRKLKKLFVAVCCCCGCICISCTFKQLEAKTDKKRIKCKWIEKKVAFYMFVPENKKNIDNLECLSDVYIKAESIIKRIKIRKSARRVAANILERMENFAEKLKDDCCKKFQDRHISSTIKLMNIKIEKLEKLLEKMDIKVDKVQSKIASLKIQVGWIVEQENI